jgi:hypothetical protein
MVTKKKKGYKIYIEINDNNWQFISEITASLESNQLEKSGSSYGKFNYFRGTILDM